MAATSYQEIRDPLPQLYVDDPRPWPVGFSAGKDVTLVAALVFDAAMSIPPEQRTKPVSFSQARQPGENWKTASRHDV